MTAVILLALLSALADTGTAGVSAQPTMLVASATPGAVTVIRPDSMPDAPAIDVTTGAVETGAVVRSARPRPARPPAEMPEAPVRDAQLRTAIAEYIWRNYADPEVALLEADAFMAAASRTGVPVQVLLAVAKQESGFNPHSISSAACEGVMQVHPAYWASPFGSRRWKVSLKDGAPVGVSPDGKTAVELLPSASRLAGRSVTDFALDPVFNIHAGAMVLKYYWSWFKDLDAALCAYNGGPGAARNWLAGRPIPAETYGYRRAIWGHLAAQQAHFRQRGLRW